MKLVVDIDDSTYKIIKQYEDVIKEICESGDCSEGMRAKLAILNGWDISKINLYRKVIYPMAIECNDPHFKPDIKKLGAGKYYEEELPDTLKNLVPPDSWYKYEEKHEYELFIPAK